MLLCILEKTDEITLKNTLTSATLSLSHSTCRSVKVCVLYNVFVFQVMEILHLALFVLSVFVVLYQVFFICTRNSLEH